MCLKTISPQKPFGELAMRSWSPMVVVLAPLASRAPLASWSKRLAAFGEPSAIDRRVLGSCSDRMTDTLALEHRHAEAFRELAPKCWHRTGVPLHLKRPRQPRDVYMAALPWQPKCVPLMHGKLWLRVLTSCREQASLSSQQWPLEGSSSCTSRLHSQLFGSSGSGGTRTPAAAAPPPATTR